MRLELHWRRFKHFLNVACRDACPDPRCTGGFREYDYNPNRDSCSVCGEMRPDLESQRAKRRWRVYWALQ